jgi:hypothetical protein
MPNATPTTCQIIFQLVFFLLLLFKTLIFSSQTKNMSNHNSQTNQKNHYFNWNLDKTGFEGRIWFCVKICELQIQLWIKISKFRTCGIATWPGN